MPVAKLKDYVMEEEVEKKADRSEAPKAPPEPENGAEEKIVISAPNKKVAAPNKKVAFTTDVGK